MMQQVRSKLSIKKIIFGFLLSFTLHAQEGLRTEIPPPRNGGFGSASGVIKNPAAPNVPAGVAQVSLPSCKKPTGKFAFNIEKGKLGDLVEFISKIECENFILDSSVKGSKEVSILTRGPVTREQAWQAFLTTLEVNEMTLVRSGKFLKIAKRTDATKNATPIIESPAGIASNDGVVTFLYDIKNLPKESIQPLVKSLVTRTGDVMPAGDNYLLITDSGVNIKRIIRILEKVDVPGAYNKIRIVDLAYADAQQTQSKLMEIFDIKSGATNASRAARIRSGLEAEEGGGGFSLSKVIVVDDSRLLLVASDKAFERAKEIIDMLDKPSIGASAQPRIYVYSVKNGDAKKMSATLANVIQTNKNKPRNPAVATENSMLEGEVKITADESTNSLLIVSSPKDYKSLLAVIQKLDKFKTMIYVEGAIFDIGMTSNEELGLNAFAGKETDLLGSGGKLIFANPGGKSVISGIASPDGLQKLANLPENLRNVAALASFVNVVGFVGPNLGDSMIPSFGAVVNALKTSSRVQLLATPSLTVLNHEKAELTSGEKIPILKGTSITGGVSTPAIPVQNVEHMDVKLKLTLTPHVSDGPAEADDQIRMELEQEVNELGQEEVLSNNQKHFRIRTKSVKTIVTARDQDPVVVGGLINDGKSNSEGKVPILGDIPIIGLLFKNTAKRVEKRNLLLVYTAYVIRSPADYQKIYRRKMEEREEFTRINLGAKPDSYDPAIDYDKKRGPLQFTIDFVEKEMKKVENGGAGDGKETVIMPKPEAALLEQAAPEEAVPPVELPKEQELPAIADEPAPAEPAQDEGVPFGSPETPGEIVEEEYPIQDMPEPVPMVEPMSEPPAEIMPPPTEEEAPLAEPLPEVTAP